MDFWAQVWSTAIGGAIAALVGGVVAGVIAWRSFSAERDARDTDREIARAEAAEDVRRQRYESVVSIVGRMYHTVSTSSDVGLARSLTVELQLAVDLMTADSPELDRDRFQFWAMNLGEMFIATVGWVDAPEWRDRTDQFGPWTRIARDQLRVWFDRSETSDVLLLDHDEAVKFFEPRWTWESLRDRT